MALFKTSNHSPSTQEIDLSESNRFSCMVNTSGEPIRAYKYWILSGDGAYTVYG